MPIYHEMAQTQGHVDCGWYHAPHEVAKVLATLPRPTFALAAPNLEESGAGKTVLLYKAWKDVNGGRYFDYPAQVIGCCVSRGYSEAVDLVQAIQISLGHKNEKYTPTSHEFIYGTARVDIGGGQLGRSDGACGAWASKAVSTIGTVAQELVGPYDDDKAKLWGYRGVPADLKAKAKDHEIKSVALVQSYAELEDAIANTYPVPVCSNQGFTMTRDSQGFCQPHGTWSHCMLICAIRNDERPGACIMQSWGMETPDGPLSLDQPPNSFWADKATVARMLAAQDSFALSGYDGYPGQRLPDNWTPSGWVA